MKNTEEIFLNKKSDIIGINDIPQEITEEILAKLAVKSLSRFKCVSKSWLSLIDSKFFMNKHLRNSETNRSCLIDGNSMIFFNKYLQNSIERSESLTSKFILQQLEVLRQNILSLWRRCYEPATGSILGCINGVLCLLERGRFFFSNPAIRISNKLPKLEIFNTPCLNFANVVSVIMDRMNQEIRCGFGWDEETDAYKVFLCIFDPRRECVGKVYSSKTNTWKTVECSGIRSNHRMIGRYNVGVFAYGKIHWISESRQHRRIEYFDLKSEMFGMVDLPSQPRRGGVWSLRESRGCLYALYRANDDDVDVPDDDDDDDDDVENDDDDIEDGDNEDVENDDDDDDDEVILNPMFDVWVMENYGVKESWVKKCTIPISHDKIEYPNSYNMDDEENIAPYIHQHYVYIESLVSPICEKVIVDESDSDESDL